MISYRTQLRAYVSDPIRTHVTDVPSRPELITRLIPTSPESFALPQIDASKETRGLSIRLREPMLPYNIRTEVDDVLVVEAEEHTLRHMPPRLMPPNIE